MSDDASVPVERRRLAVQLERGFVELSYLMHSPPGSRSAVICLHDFLGNSADFERLGVFLAGHGFTVVRPDMFGRGESAYLEPGDYNPHTYLLGLLAIIGSLGTRRINLVGKGWGGLLALGVAALPDASIRRLVLADPGFPWRLAVDEPVAAAARGPAITSLEAARHLLAGSSEFSGLPPTHMLSLLDGRLRQADGGYRLDFDPALLSEEALGRFGRIDTRSLFTDVTARVLCMAAGTLTERQRQRMHRVGLPSPTRSIAQNVGPGSRVHFTSAHELLLTLGFLTSRFLPSF